MTENTNTQAASKPILIAYHSRKGDDGKTYWTRIGAVFAHNKGKGQTLLQDLVPLDGRVVMFPPSEKPE